MTEAVPFDQWGVQPTGFVVPTFEDILAKIQSDQRSLISAEWDTDPDSAEGVNAGIFARQMARAWQVLGQVHDAYNRDNSAGELLNDLGKMTGTARQPARPTVVSATCTLDEGTTLTPGSAFCYPIGRPAVLFTPSEVYVADVDGTHAVVFEAVEPGPTIVAAGELTVISGNVTGWTAVTNAADGALGRLVETDEEFRQSQEADLARAGSSTTAAVAIDVMSAGLAGVIDCKCYANIGPDLVDADGRPPMHFEIVLEVDGSQVAADVARVIWDTIPGGHSTFGTESATVVDENGEIHTVYWNEIVLRQIWVEYELSVGAGYVGDSALSDYVAEQCAAVYGASDDVIALRVKATPLPLAGVIDVTDFRIGLTATPTAEVNIPMGVREKASFAAARITRVIP